jgi:hypothetical protein
MMHPNMLDHAPMSSQACIIQGMQRIKTYVHEKKSLTYLLSLFIVSAPSVLLYSKLFLVAAIQWARKVYAAAAKK